jgi:hypothetical protein
MEVTKACCPSLFPVFTTLCPATWPAEDATSPTDVLETEVLLRLTGSARLQPREKG